MKRFWGFCGQYSVTDPFPVTEHLLCAFAAHSADAGLAGQTNKSYLTAVRNTQLSLGFPDPREQSSLPILKRVQAGIARVRLGRGQPSRIRLPITAQILRQIKQELSRTAHPERLLLWAVCCTGFCRLGELLLSSQSAFTPRRHLAWGDMVVDNPQTASMVRYHLKQSKTDQAGQGVDIILGRTGLDLCPVTAVLSYVAARGGRAGPFFLTTAGVPLTKQAFISELRKLLRTIGLPDESYAGHSYRIGAATFAALAGIENSTIQLLGRWQSSAFLRYIRTPQDRLVAISVSLASQFHQGASPGQPTMGH